MFGLEQQKKKKGEEFVFELEQELKSVAGADKMRLHIEERVRVIKQMLRSGESDKAEFERAGILLHGYTSFLKVMARLKNPKR